MASPPPQARDYAAAGEPTDINMHPLRPIQIDIEAQSSQSPTSDVETKSLGSPTESAQFRKVGRSNTATTYRPRRTGQEWHPGQEPGIDVEDLTDGRTHAGLEQIHEECDITVVDFSQEDMRMHHLENRTLQPFLAHPRPTWSTCRWISVNGLSWDVVRTLSKNKALHRLAIEDLMNPRNRTKADWYYDHTYMVLPLQKLIHFHSDSDCDSDCSDLDEAELPQEAKRKKKKRRFWPFNRSSRKTNFRRQPPKPMQPRGQATLNGAVTAHMSPSTKGSLGQIRTLQRYHGGPNEERIVFMEKHSALASKSLGVGVEQVSVFLTSDNTVISFFENSAEDVEVPLIRRLNTPEDYFETVLRR